MRVCASVASVCGNRACAVQILSVVARQLEIKKIVPDGGQEFWVYGGIEDLNGEGLCGYNFCLWLQGFGA